MSFWRSLGLLIVLFGGTLGDYQIQSLDGLCSTTLLLDCSASDQRGGTLQFDQYPIPGCIVAVSLSDDCARDVGPSAIYINVAALNLLVGDKVDIIDFSDESPQGSHIKSLPGLLQVPPLRSFGQLLTKYDDVPHFAISFTSGSLDYASDQGGNVSGANSSATTSTTPSSSTAVSAANSAASSTTLSSSNASSVDSDTSAPTVDPSSNTTGSSASTTVGSITFAAVTTEAAPNSGANVIGGPSVDVDVVPMFGNMPGPSGDPILQLDFSIHAGYEKTGDLKCAATDGFIPWELACNQMSRINCPETYDDSTPELINSADPAPNDQCGEGGGLRSYSGGATYSGSGYQSSYNAYGSDGSSTAASISIGLIITITTICILAFFVAPIVIICCVIYKRRTQGQVQGAVMGQPYQNPSQQVIVAVPQQVPVASSV